MDRSGSCNRQEVCVPLRPARACASQGGAEAVWGRLGAPAGQALLLHRTDTGRQALAAGRAANAGWRAVGNRRWDPLLTDDPTQVHAVVLVCARHGSN